MKVQLLKDNSILEVNDRYGIRLLEQKKAVIVKEAAKKSAAKKKAKADENLELEQPTGKGD